MNHPGPSGTWVVMTISSAPRFLALLALLAGACADADTGRGADELGPADGGGKSDSLLDLGTGSLCFGGADQVGAAVVLERGDAYVDTIVIHSAEGSYDSAINTFVNGTTGTSAHYVIGLDGSVTCMISEELAGRHSGHHTAPGDVDARSIGIELEGCAVVGSPSCNANLPAFTGFTPEQIETLGAVVRTACSTHGIPCDRNHVIAHAEVPNPCVDPDASEDRSGVAGLPEQCGGALSGITDINDSSSCGGFSGRSDPGLDFDWSALMSEVDPSGPWAGGVGWDERPQLDYVLLGQELVDAEGQPVTVLAPGETATVRLRLRNTGTNIWEYAHLALIGQATTGGVPSPLRDADSWLAYHSPRLRGYDCVGPFAEVSYELTIRAPDDITEPTDVLETFVLELRLPNGAGRVINAEAETIAVQVRVEPAQ